MAHLQYFNYAGYGETAKENYHYSQAVRVGDSVHCSGQGGWDRQTSKVPDDEESQIDQAFDNVQEALRVAGVENGWEKVYKVTSYHVPVSDTGISAMIRNLRKYCPGHQPVWTLIGPAKLAFPEMKVEIQVEAHVATGVAQ